MVSMIKQCKLKSIGIDAISFDAIDSTTLEIHKQLLGADVCLIENLTGLQKLPEKAFHLYYFPLKLNTLDASPVRAVAQID
jgi:arylformamidase